MILCVRVRVCVCVSAVSQNRAADQRRVVEALHVELGSVLERGGKKRVRERDKQSSNYFTDDAPKWKTNQPSKKHSKKIKLNKKARLDVSFCFQCECQAKLISCTLWLYN